MAAPAVLVKLTEAETLKDKVKYYHDTLGDLSDIRVLFNQVLVAIYVGSQYIPGTKIIRPHDNVKEDIFQGSAGLVLKIGPTAFDNRLYELSLTTAYNDATQAKAAEKERKEKMTLVKVGDWITFTPGDGKRIQINGIDCRVIEDTRILMVIDDPEIITHRQ